MIGEHLLIGGPGHGKAVTFTSSFLRLARPVAPTAFVTDPQEWPDVPLPIVDTYTSQRLLLGSYFYRIGTMVYPVDDQMQMWAIDTLVERADATRFRVSARERGQR